MSDSEDNDFLNVWDVFAPRSSRGLRVDYPELSDYEEFKSVKVAELYFVWLFACKASPLFNANLKKREMIEACMERAKIRIVEPEKKEKFLSGSFPEKIEKAIRQMYLFEPSVRILAKQIAIKQLYDVKKMTSLKLNDNGDHVSFNTKDGDIDMNKKKQYMSMIMDANKSIGAMVEKAEKGFGVSKKENKVSDKNLEGSGDTFTESYHDNN